MIECIECSGFAESFVAYQCLLPFEPSLLVMAEIEGDSLARQLGVRRATLLQKLSFSWDFGYPKTNEHSRYHPNLSSHPYQSFLLAKQNDDKCVAEIFVGENMLTMLVVKLLLLIILLVAF